MSNLNANDSVLSARDNVSLPHASQASEHTQVLQQEAQSSFSALEQYFRPSPIDLPVAGPKGGTDGMHVGPDGIVVQATVTDKDRTDATRTLEKGFSRLISEGDRASMNAITEAITGGDVKAFAEAIKKAGGDPKKLKDIVNEVDKALAAKGSPTRLDVAADGTVVATDATSTTAVAINPATGAVSARGVEHNMDGTTTLKPGEVLHADTAKIFKNMGDDAVRSMSGDATVTSILPRGFAVPKGGPIEDPSPWNRPIGSPWGRHLNDADLILQKATQM